LGYLVRTIKKHQYVFDNQIFVRVMECSVGWSLMDVSFEMCQFFAEKLEASYEELAGKDGESKEGYRWKWINK
jgi:hypothetical protein